MSINIRDIAALAFEVVEEGDVVCSLLKRINIGSSELVVGPAAVDIDTSKFLKAEVLGPPHLVEWSHNQALGAIQLVSEQLKHFL